MSDSQGCGTVPILMTKIAVPITVLSLDDALRDAAAAVRAGADLVELRIDRFTDHPEQLAPLVERAALPCIVTCRPTWEGGAYDGDETTRISVLEAACLGPRQPAYLDVELAAYQRSANIRQKIGLVVDHPGQVRPVTTKLILSSHDFDGRPVELHERVRAMADAPACRVIKIVWTAQSLADNVEAFRLIADQPKPTIALCMGEAGLPSRVLAGKFGAELTFATLARDAATAPGQPTIRDLKDLYRWDAIGAATRVYGVIGDPVSHSMGPAIHNAAFGEVGHDGVYLPLRVRPGYGAFESDIAAWLDHDELHVVGASVTIPHKQNLLRFVRDRGGRVEALAETIGAANTLAIDGGGALSASNTDYAAALDAVCAAMGTDRSGLAGKTVAVIGAGGVARAVVAGFAQHDANVTIYNRTVERARELADGFGRQSGATVLVKPLDQLRADGADIYVNCTPIGMHPNTGETPMPIGDNDLAGHAPVIFDTIYNPIETRLLREARSAGCKTVSGVEMFVRQAAAQFTLWTGQPAPVDLMRRIVEQRLNDSGNT